MPQSDKDRASNLIWIDLEMTGLSPEKDTIIEIATIVTDKHLNELAEGPVMAISQTAETMDAMDEWNTRQHGESGLTARVLASDVEHAEAEQATLEFLARWVDAGASPMCGNSICQDRRFLAREMPDLERYFHYRNLDVSTSRYRTFVIRSRNSPGTGITCCRPRRLPPAMTEKPFAEAAARNAAPILEVLRREFEDCRAVLEIGSGTGQHAVIFAGELPHLDWQTSDGGHFADAEYLRLAADRIQEILVVTNDPSFTELLSVGDAPDNAQDVTSSGSE